MIVNWLTTSPLRDEISFCSICQNHSVLYRLKLTQTLLSLGFVSACSIVTNHGQ